MALGQRGVRGRIVLVDGCEEGGQGRDGVGRRRLGSCAECYV